MANRTDYVHIKLYNFKRTNNTIFKQGIVELMDAWQRNADMKPEILAELHGNDFKLRGQLEQSFEHSGNADLFVVLGSRLSVTQAESTERPVRMGI